MAALGDQIVFVIVVAGLLAALSLLLVRTPATPQFARRAATSATVQLRQDPNGSFLLDRGFLFRRRFWFVGTCCPPVRIRAGQYRQLATMQLSQPVPVARAGRRAWWWFEGEFYWESGQYGERDVLALIRDRQRRSAKRLDRAHMLLNVDEGRTPGPATGVSQSRVRCAAPSLSGTGENARNAKATSIFNMTMSSRWPWAAPPR